jgi:formylmethanofuran dehydrogenase subunit B
VSAVPAADNGERLVCTACPLVCDDILLRAGGNPATGPQPFFERACVSGAAWLAKAWEVNRAAEAVVDGADVRAAFAMPLAAERLAACRRVLVTGLQDAALETVTAAADLAEALQAAFDAGSPEAAMLSGPVAARIGRVTADFEELRDRADCVLLWCIDPRESHPRFIERFLEPDSAKGERKVFVIGAEVEDGADRGWRHVAVPRDQAAEAAVTLQSMLQERLAGNTPPSPERMPAGRQPLEQLLASVAEACLEAGCVGVVSGGSEADATGTAAAAISRLVILLAHQKPAFEIPLSCGASGAGPATATAVSTWRYGAAGAVAVADRNGGTQAPAEADACRLIERGEVDGVVVVGQPPAAVRKALAGFEGVVVAVGGEAGKQWPPQVWIGTAATAIATEGQLLRDDGRLVTLRAVRASARPAAATVLAAIRAHLPRREMP